MQNYINNNICENDSGATVFRIFSTFEYETVHFFFMFLSNGGNLRINVAS